MTDTLTLHRPFQVPTDTGAVVVNQSAIDATEVVEHPLFKSWFDALDERYVVHRITIQSVDKFGSHIRFIKMLVEATDVDDNTIPGVVFLRGDSVAILPVLICEGVEYALLTTQSRLPTTHFDYQEIPAGSLENGTFAGTAVREMKEETGLDLNDFTRIELTTQPLFLSPGACDEEMTFFAARRKVTKAELDELRGKMTGVAEENERIVLNVVPLDALALSPDAKTVLAWALYKYGYTVEQLKRGVV